MLKFGCAAKALAMGRQFRYGMLARSKMMAFSGPFFVTNGYKQGCVLAPTLISMMCFAMLTDAFYDGDNGTPSRNRF